MRPFALYYSTILDKINDVLYIGLVELFGSQVSAQFFCFVICSELNPVVQNGSI